MRMRIGQGKPPRGFTAEEWGRMEEVRNFLCSFQLCAEMLNLRRFERKRARPFCDPCDCEDILQGSERFWRARMYEVGKLINKMPSGHEKLMLYYHYIHGESIEHISDVLGVSRRTGYRIHARALRTASGLFCHQNKIGSSKTVAHSIEKTPCKPYKTQNSPHTNKKTEEANHDEARS